MSMKVLLLNPPFLDKFSKSSRSPGVTKSATIYFPLWLSYAAGVLDKEGYDLKMIDDTENKDTYECFAEQVLTCVQQNKEEKNESN